MEREGDDLEPASESQSLPLDITNGEKQNQIETIESTENKPGPDGNGQISHESNVIDTILDYGELDDNQPAAPVEPQVDAAPEESGIPTPSLNQTVQSSEKVKESKLTSTEEEKRLREEVKRSFQRSSSQLTNQPSSHVRIDNFQRPLTLRTLIQWLEEKLNLKIADGNIWLNSIKTHCYISFESLDQSRACKETIEGLKYPPTNPLTLTVNYTKVGASDALKSPEAAMKYADWKASLAPQHVPITKRLGPKVNVSDNSGEASAPASASVGPSSGTSLGKRKQSGGLGVGLGGAMFGVLRNTLHTAAAATAQEQHTNSVKSPRIDRNTTPKTVTQHIQVEEEGSNRTAAPTPKQAAGQAPAQATVKVKTNERKVSNKEQKKTTSRIPLNETKELTLDDFFKKTVAIPQLYWLPVPEDEVERRRQQKVLAK